MVAAELIHFTHDGLKCRLVRISPMLPSRWQFAARQQLLECNATARDAALDRTDCTAADFGCLLVSKPARADEDQRFTLRLSIGNIRTEERHVALAWQKLQDAARLSP